MVFLFHQSEAAPTLSYLQGLLLREGKRKQKLLDSNLLVLVLTGVNKKNN